MGSGDLGHHFPGQAELPFAVELQGMRPGVFDLGSVGRQQGLGLGHMQSYDRTYKEQACFAPLRLHVRVDADMLGVAGRRGRAGFAVTC